MHKRALDNQSGAGMVELLIGIVAAVILLGLATVTFTRQQTLFKNQNDETNIRALGRYGIRELAKDLRMAGYGLPASLAVSSASSTAITYRTNSDDVSATAASDISAAATTVTLTAADVDSDGSSDLASGQSVVIFTAASSEAELATVSSVAGNVLTLSSATDNAYSTDDAIFVNKYHTVAYSYDAANKKIVKSVDGGTDSTLVENATSLTFVYRNSANAALTSPLSAADLTAVRKIEISLALQDSLNASASAQYDTAVELRNLM
ncbi:MAG: hypothetical protein HY579_07935 [Nitrospinae bacterium]|nr:hypothetical protein [Nitrospinota bacterium]